MPVQPLYLHDQRLYPFEARLGVEYGLSKTVGVEFQLPIRIIVARIEYTDTEGDHYDPEDPHVHHRDETVWGIADPLLMMRWGKVFQKTYFAARAGFSLPLGKTEEDPFALGDEGIPHQHIQLGTGTFDPTLALEVSRKAKKWTFSGFGQGGGSFYRNEHGFQAPVRFQAAGDVNYALTEKWSSGLALGVFFEAAERWQGEIRQDASLGRTELYSELSIACRISESVLTLTTRVPFFRHIVEGDEELGEYAAPLAIQLGYIRSFDWGEKP